jgi:hypothetical protein
MAEVEIKVALLQKISLSLSEIASNETGIAIKPAMPASMNTGFVCRFLSSLLSIGSCSTVKILHNNLAL